MSIPLPNGIRIVFNDNYKWNKSDAEFFKALCEIPVEDINPILPKTGEGCAFIDTQPERPLSEKAKQVRENLRDIFVEWKHIQSKMK